MNKKLMKVLSIVLMVLMVASISTMAFATNDDYMALDQFKNASQKDTQTTGVFQSFIATIINLVQVVGMGVAIIMLIVMAIKYISAAPSEKAEIKKSITIYIVGAIVLFAATGILQLIKNFANANLDVKETTTSTAVVEVVDLDVA